MSIRVYEKNGKVLYQVYVGKASKENPKLRVQKYSSGHTSKAAAERDEKRLIEVVSRELARLEGKGQSWDFVINRWEMEARSGNLGSYSTSTIDDHVSCLRKWTKSWLNKSACELNKADGRAVIRFIAESGKSVSWQKKVKNTVNVVFNFGLEEGLIQGAHTSPVYGIKLNEKKEKVPDILTIDQARFLLSEAKRQNNPWYSIWAIALFTGMRNGELFALEWSDIYSKVNNNCIAGDNEKIMVSKSYNKRTNEIKSTKAGYWRTIPISSQLNEVLKELYVERRNEQYVLPRLRMWRQGCQAKTLKMFCKQIGLPEIKFHALRACFATLMLSLGVPPATVMKICGWCDLDTMARYVRLAGLEEKGATEKLDLLFKAPTQKPEAVGNVVKLFQNG